MPVGLSDGTSYADSADWFAAAIDNRSEKKRSDQMEINTNSTAGDFQSRFYATDASTMPLEASTELAGALKLKGSTGAPENRSVLEKLTGSDGGERFQTWPERLTRSAFTLPGDVLSGKVEPGSIQEIERAADLAGLVVLGPAPVAARLADGTLGSFAGVKSKTLPKDKLYEAQNMELDAMHPDDIWDKTGFFRGADSRWRYEIPDKDAKLKMESFDTIPEFKRVDLPGIGTRWDKVDTSTPQGDKIVPKSPERPIANFGDLVFPGPKKSLSLDQVIDHPELFKAYPELKTMKVEPLPEYAKAGGAKGMVMGDTIYLAEGHPEYVKSVVLHEIQHGIQSHEGFALGGHQEYFLPKGWPKAKNLLEEAETFITNKAEEVGVKKDDLTKLKFAVRHETDDQSPAMSWISTTVQEAKDKGLYERLKKLIKSEDLMQAAKDEAFSKYQRLMGEVEARNVQVRRNYDDATRRISPQRTEDVARFLQHDPK